MATTLRRRGVAVTAFALASGTTLAAFGTAAPAGASANHAPAFYQGVTEANVLSVALNLPSALPELPGVPKNLAVNLIGVNGNAVHNTLGTGLRTSSTSVSSVASGSLVKVLPIPGLSKVLTARLGQNLKDSALPPIAADPLVNLHVGDLAAKALTGVNASHSVLVNGKVGDLGQLLDLKALGKNITLIDALNQQVDGVSSQVTDQLDAALSTVQQVLNQTPAGSTAAQTLGALQAALKTVQAKVKSILANVGSTAVLTVNTLDASQSIAPAGNAAKSVAGVNLANLNVLNGLVTVKGFVTQATAIANGRPGGAHASFSGHAPIAQVGTPLLTATLDETGISLSDVQGLPQDVTEQVNSALAQLLDALNTLLNTLGVHLTYVPGHVVEQTSDGKKATAVGPEYDITVDSPVDKAPLVFVGLGHNTMASVSAAQAPKIVKLPNPQQGALPHTGANMPLIGGIALALMIGAAVLRRRIA